MPIVLDTTDKSIVAELIETVTLQPQFVTSYVDRNKYVATEKGSDGTLADATTTTLVSAPSSNIQREVNYISIHNPGISAITVSIKLNNNSNYRILRYLFIPPSSTVVYHDKQWSLYNFLDSPSDGWIPCEEVFTDANNPDAPVYQATVPGNVTGKYSLGMKFKITQSGTVRYFFLVKIAYSDPNTTLTWYGGTDYTLAGGSPAPALSLPYYSREKAPFGFPLDPLKWTASYSTASAAYQSSPGASTWYNPGTPSLSLPIGAWLFSYQVVGFTTYSTGGPSILITASTANNSESDTELTSALSTSAVTIGAQCTRSKTIVVEAKTPYYLNCSRATGNSDQIGFWNSVGKLVMKATCAYL